MNHVTRIVVLTHVLGFYMVVCSGFITLLTGRPPLLFLPIGYFSSHCLDMLTFSEGSESCGTSDTKTLIKRR